MTIRAPSFANFSAMARPIPVAAPVRYQLRSYSGWGPFRAEFVPPPPGQRLEIRVWAPRGTAVSVYRARLVPVG